MSRNTALLTLVRLTALVYWAFDIFPTEAVITLLSKLLAFYCIAQSAPGPKDDPECRTKGDTCARRKKVQRYGGTSALCVKHTLAQRRGRDNSAAVEQSSAHTLCTLRSIILIKLRATEPAEDTPPRS